MVTIFIFIIQLFFSIKETFWIIDHLIDVQTEDEKNLTQKKFYHKYNLNGVCTVIFEI